MEGYTFDVVWQSLDEAGQAELARLWIDQGVAPSAEAARKRATQAVTVVRDPEGAIVGAMTCVAQRYAPLENRFWFLRSFVHPEHRRFGLAKGLVVPTREALEASFEAGDTDCIGMLAEIQSPELLQIRAAVWPTSKLMFVGWNARGEPVRVYYFRGARVA